MSNAFRIDGPYFQAFDPTTGDPLAGGKVYTYQSGTTTLKPSYTTETANVANANPVILDSDGKAAIHLSGVYKIVLYDADDVLVWTADPVTSATQLAQEWINQATATYVNATTFTLVGDWTEFYTPFRQVRIQDASTLYDVIVSSSYGLGVTTIVISRAQLTGFLSVSWARIVADTGMAPYGLLDMQDMDLGLMRYIAYRSTPGDGGHGWFEWNGSDLSAEVAADPLHGIFAPSSADPTGALGAWVRQWNTRINAAWLGLVEGGSTDNYAAITAADALAVFVATQLSGAHIPIEFPQGIYGVSQTVIQHAEWLGQGRENTTIKAIVSGWSGTSVVQAGSTTGVYGTRLVDMQIDCSEINGVIGYYSKRINEESGPVRLVVVDHIGAPAIKIEHTGGANEAQNWMLQDCEAIGAEGITTGTDGVVLAGGVPARVINGITVTRRLAGSGQGDAAIKIDGIHGVAQNIHVENYADGILIGSTAACAGLVIAGVQAATANCDNTVRISSSTDSEDITLIGIRKAGTNTIVDETLGNTITTDGVPMYVIGTGATAARTPRFTFDIDKYTLIGPVISPTLIARRDEANNPGGACILHAYNKEITAGADGYVKFTFQTSGITNRTGGLLLITAITGAQLAAAEVISAAVAAAGTMAGSAVGTGGSTTGSITIAAPEALASPTAGQFRVKITNGTGVTVNFDATFIGTTQIGLITDMDWE